MKNKAISKKAQRASKKAKPHVGLITVNKNSHFINPPKLKDIRTHAHIVRSFTRQPQILRSSNLVTKLEVHNLQVGRKTRIL
jgi:acyl-coenzyme A thioesterase PaaI-like protein